MRRTKTWKMIIAIFMVSFMAVTLRAKTPVMGSSTVSSGMPSASGAAKLYIQPQLGMGYSLNRGSSIAILGSYVGVEFNKFRLGISGSVGASINYYGVQFEKMFKISNKETLTLRVGNLGRLSSNIGLMYENREGNVSFVFGPEICTRDIVTMGVSDLSFAATVGLGFKGK